MRRPARPLVVLAWNLYVANRAANVEAWLEQWIGAHRPHVVVLNEARTHGRTLQRVARRHGYVLFQERPVPKPATGPVDDTGSTAVMVRRDVDVIRRRVVGMRRRWMVFSHRRWHTPRRYEVITIHAEGRRWKIRASHWPTNGFDGGNRAAFAESARRARRWARASRVPALIVGDLNETKARIAAWAGRRFVVAGHHIDLLIGRRVASVDHTRLPKGGSDHHAQLYAVVPRDR